MSQEAPPVRKNARGSITRLEKGEKPEHIVNAAYACGK